MGTVQNRANQTHEVGCTDLEVRDGMMIYWRHVSEAAEIRK